MKFSIKDFFSKWDQIQKTADSVTFIEEILNEKLHLLRSVIFMKTVPHSGPYFLVEPVYLLVRVIL